MNTKESVKQAPEPANLVLHRKMYEARLRKLNEIGGVNSEEENQEVEKDKEDEGVSR